jgi:beta-carotene 3-hydroxylase
MPDALLWPLLIISTIALTEMVSWAVHRYILHGPLWFLHISHHRVTSGPFEWNDLIILIYALPSFFLTYFGLELNNIWLAAPGIGIAAYGVMYFFVHDIWVHRRIKLKWKTPRKGYFRAVIRAHKRHHAHLERDESEAFGFLFVPRRYWP